MPVSPFRSRGSCEKLAVPVRDAADVRNQAESTGHAEVSTRNSPRCRNGRVLASLPTPSPPPLLSNAPCDCDLVTTGNFLVSYQKQHTGTCMVGGWMDVASSSSLLFCAVRNVPGDNGNCLSSPSLCEIYFLDSQSV